MPTLPRCFARVMDFSLKAAHAFQSACASHIHLLEPRSTGETSTNDAAMAELVDALP
jgi:hypothetical protein